MTARPQFLAILLSCALAGCAGKAIREQMTTYVGQPVSTVIAKLGFPTAEEKIAGSKVYIWSTGQMVRGTTFDCKIRAIVDAKDIITKWDLDGNERGCEGYAAALTQ